MVRGAIASGAAERTAPLMTVVVLDWSTDDFAAAVPALQRASAEPRQ